MECVPTRGTNKLKQITSDVLSHTKPRTAQEPGPGSNSKEQPPVNVDVQMTLKNSWLQSVYVQKTKKIVFQLFISWEVRTNININISS